MTEKVVVLYGEQQGQEFPLDGSPVTVGADEGCQVRLTDAGVLPRHAVIERLRGVWRLRALDTSRPLDAEGRLVTELRLDHGTSWNLGRARLRFVTLRAVIQASAGEGEGPVDRGEAVARLGEARRQILEQVSRIIVGQQDVVTQVLVSLFARGHCLLVGVPGLAKTLMVRTLAATLDLDAKRIQFTPDLMPADITGTDILEEDAGSGRRTFRFNRGPLFTNLLLADEINRTPPKTQAALLEAMQERRVTSSGVTYDLPDPFLVLATQNPIELEGTYPLPEAQLDRFMFSVFVDYPSEQEEPEILMATTRDRAWEVERVLNAEAILGFQHLVRQVPVSEHVARYASSLARATRPGGRECPESVSPWVRWGAGPRAGQCLLLAAKAHVVFDGKFNVSCADVRRYALPVLRHRIFRNFAAASEGVTTDEIVKRIVEHVREPEY